MEFSIHSSHTNLNHRNSHFVLDGLSSLYILSIFGGTLSLEGADVNSNVDYCHGCNLCGT